MNKIAILSDIHGNIHALKKVVADFERRGVDLVVNLGDHVSGPLWPKETLAYLQKQDWVHIRGNHERQLTAQEFDRMGLSDQYAHQQLDASELAWLANLPEKLMLGDEILLCHGSPSDDKQYLLETIKNGRCHLAAPEEVRARLGNAAAPVILCGHTHFPRVVNLPGALVVNPGSVGLAAYDDVEPEMHVIETGSPHARYAILDRYAGEWNVELIALEYEFHTAVEQAVKNGREDWAVGLRTGYMTTQ